MTRCFTYLHNAAFAAFFVLTLRWPNGCLNRTSGLSNSKLVRRIMSFKYSIFE